MTGREGFGADSDVRGPSLVTYSSYKYPSSGVSVRGETIIHHHREFEGEQLVHNSPSLKDLSIHIITVMKLLDGCWLAPRSNYIMFCVFYLDKYAPVILRADKFVSHIW